MLIAIKLVHTVIWVVLAGSILALPLLARFRQFRWATILSVVVWIECLVILSNTGRCPLTDWAARFTTDRSPNFDIYLPEWLARNNKMIFGVMFAVGEVVVAFCWWRGRHARTT